jgi:3-hydroxybutyryl-CoA dehydrogenase
MNTDPIGVAGLGYLGRSIAACLLAHGFRVVGYTVGRDTHEVARDYIGNAIAELIERSGFPASLAATWPERYIPAPSLSDFAPCEFVIESVLEDLDIKQQVFDQIEAVVGAGVPIASNTSAIPITSLQERRRHPGRFLGMHWCQPAYATRFLELIRGAHTQDPAIQLAAALAQQVGKESCLVAQDVPGFIANRLAYAMYREALHLLETGVADAETIDRAFRNSCGLWATLCGPLRWIDITGGPALYAKAMQGVLPTLSNASVLPKTLETMWRNDDRGTINGRGFYTYGPEDAQRWEALLHRHAWAVHDLQDDYFPPSGGETH